MIVELLLMPFIALADLIIGILPDFSLTFWDYEVIDFTHNLVRLSSYIIPFDVVYNILWFEATWYGLSVTYAIIEWIYHKIPFSID